MKKRFISTGITLFLMFSLIFIWFLINTNYFLGPYYKNFDKYKKIVENQMSNLNISEYKLLEVSHLNQTVYVVSANQDSIQKLIWFDDLLHVLFTCDISQFKEEDIMAKATELNLENYTINYSYYKDRPMIMLDNHSMQVFVDFETLEVALIYYKKVV